MSTQWLLTQAVSLEQYLVHYNYLSMYRAYIFPKRMNEELDGK